MRPYLLSCGSALIFTKFLIAIAAPVGPGSDVTTSTSVRHPSSGDIETHHASQKYPGNSWIEGFMMIPGAYTQTYRRIFIPHDEDQYEDAVVSLLNIVHYMLKMDLRDRNKHTQLPRFLTRLKDKHNFMSIPNGWSGSVTKVNMGDIEWKLQLEEIVEEHNEQLWYDPEGSPGREVVREQRKNRGKNRNSPQPRPHRTLLPKVEATSESANVLPAPLQDHHHGLTPFPDVTSMQSNGGMATPHLPIHHPVHSNGDMVELHPGGINPSMNTGQFDPHPSTIPFIPLVPNFATYPPSQPIFHPHFNDHPIASAGQGMPQLTPDIQLFPGQMGASLDPGSLGPWPDFPDPQYSDTRSAMGTVPLNSYATSFYHGPEMRYLQPVIPTSVFPPINPSTSHAVPTPEFPSTHHTSEHQNMQGEVDDPYNPYGGGYS